MNSHKLFVLLSLILCVHVSTATLDCSDLKHINIELSFIQRKLISSIIINNATLFGGTAGIPYYCEVDGQIDSNAEQAGIIFFQVRLPTNWNQRYLFNGNFGYGGSLGFYGTYNQPSDFPGVTGLEATIMGYANAVNDLGTSGAPNPATADITEQKRFFVASPHLTTIVVKDIIRQYYGHGPAYSYLGGCSTGGLTGLYEVTRFPRDFDGIIAHDALPKEINAAYRYGQLVLDNNLLNNDPFVNRTVFEAAYDVAVAKCGDEDGLIRDAYRCEWDPEVDLFPVLDLNENQKNFFRSFYSDLVNDYGDLINRRFPPGSERDAALHSRSPRSSHIWRTKYRRIVGRFLEMVGVWERYVFF